MLSLSSTSLPSTIMMMVTGCVARCYQQQGKFEAAEVLLRVGKADPMAKNKEGKTPLDLNCTHASGDDEDNKEPLTALVQVREKSPTFVIIGHPGGTNMMMMMMAGVYPSGR